VSPLVRKTTSRSIYITLCRHRPGLLSINAAGHTCLIYLMNKTPDAPNKGHP
jgi:hypothetical protein